jgi:hypothetical protein
MSSLNRRSIPKYFSEEEYMADDIVTQTRAAYDFLEKLFLETSYLIKEIEGILYDEIEKFVIGRPRGYQVSAKSSAGLETKNVKLWLFRKFGVFFVPESETKIIKRGTTTKLHNDLELIYLRIVLNDPKEITPSIYSGVIYNIWAKESDKKFERLMSTIQDKDEKIFKNPENPDYEDPLIKLKGKFVKNNLFDMQDSNALVDKIVNPTLDLYRNLSR